MPDFTELREYIGEVQYPIYQGALNFSPGTSSPLTIPMCSIPMYTGDIAIYGRKRLVNASTTATLEYNHDSTINMQVPTGKKWKVAITIEGVTSLGDVVVRGSTTLDTADGTVLVTFNILTGFEYYTSALLELTAAQYLTITNPAGANCNILAYGVETNA